VLSVFLRKTGKSKRSGKRVLFLLGQFSLLTVFQKTWQVRTLESSC